MGCTGSRFDEMPVTGHRSGFAVIPTPDYRYLRPEATVLKLREKFWSLTGDDFRIKVQLISIEVSSVLVTTGH